MVRNRLPIEDILPEVREKLTTGNNLVLAAQPGAGKTTLVPLALLTAGWLAGRRILVLEPRRLAARTAADYMARLLGEKAGQTVGYRVRLDSKVGQDTRIEIITEGILTRMLQADPQLAGVGLVIFDEFHERSLQADLGLALCLETQAVLRPDLKLLIMSATLDAGEIAVLLGNAPVLKSPGRTFPVETYYRERPVEGSMVSAVCETILQALRENKGDILAFLPGAGEIRQAESELRKHNPEPGIHIAPLYGNLPAEIQDRAILPSTDGKRKVVLATSIAETSLTVEGIGIVIDSGLMRVPRFSLRTGMTGLDTVRVSQASADQRRGRAGRLGPGVCYRLWTKKEAEYLTPYNVPEILASDLAGLALELALWGVREPEQLTWPDVPPEAAFQQARQLLYDLGALDAAGGITAHGKAMAAAGIHPRLAHMILQAKALDLGLLACDLAAVLSVRELTLREAGSRENDVRERVEVLRNFRQGNDRQAFNRAACRLANREALQMRRVFQIEAKEEEERDACGLLLAFAYPERIAARRENGGFLLRSGRGAVVAGKGEISYSPYIVAAEVDDTKTDSRIFLAAPLLETDLLLYFNDQLEEGETVVWDQTAHAVRSKVSTRLGALLLRENPAAEPDPDKVLKALLAGIAQEGLGILPWTRQSSQLRQRMLFMHRHNHSWPDVSDENLLATLNTWLGPYVYGLTSKTDLQRLHMTEILDNLLSWEKRRELEEWAPTHILVPSGQKVPVDYSDPAMPVLSVRLQQLFGLTDTPRIAGGAVRLTLHLLSPANRPVQVTQDLASFWQSAYFAVRKDLQGRYPKHYWPDNPLLAEATHRTRPRH